MSDSDMSPHQPDDREPSEHAIGDELDFVDKTVAKITDAEVEEQLRRVLDQSGRGRSVPEHLWRDRCQAPIFMVDICPSIGAAESGSWAADILAAKLSHGQVRGARQSIAAARQNAEQIVADARAEADAALEQAAKMVRDAREKAEQIISDAHSEADEIIRTARNHSLQPMAGSGGSAAGLTLVGERLLDAPELLGSWCDRLEAPTWRRRLIPHPVQAARSRLFWVTPAANVQGAAVVRGTFAVEPGGFPAVLPAFEVKCRSRDPHAPDGMADCEPQEHTSLRFRADGPDEQIGNSVESGAVGAKEVKWVVTAHAVEGIVQSACFAGAPAAGHPGLDERVYALQQTLLLHASSLIRMTQSRDSDDETPPREIWRPDQLHGVLRRGIALASTESEG
jgi:nucleotide-binding universal stress UspA family protein